MEAENKGKKKTTHSNSWAGAENQPSSPVTETNQENVISASTPEKKRRSSSGFFGGVGERIGKFFSPKNSPRTENFGDDDVATSPTEMDKNASESSENNDEQLAEQKTLSDDPNETIEQISGEGENNETGTENDNASVDTSADQQEEISPEERKKRAENLKKFINEATSLNENGLIEIKSPIRGIFVTLNGELFNKLRGKNEIGNNELVDDLENFTKQKVEFLQQQQAAETARPAPEEGEITSEGGDTAIHTADLEETDEATTATELPNEDSDEVVITKISEESSKNPTPYLISNPQTKTSDNSEPKNERSDDERNIGLLEGKLGILKADIQNENTRKELSPSLRDNDNWGDYWNIIHGNEKMSIEDFIRDKIEDSGRKLEAWNSFQQTKNETLQELRRIWENEARVKKWIKDKIERNKERFIREATPDVSDKVLYIEGVVNKNYWTTQWNNQRLTIPYFIDTEIENESDRNELKTFFETTITETVAEVRRKLYNPTVEEEIDEHFLTINPDGDSPETPERPAIPETPVTKEQRDTKQPDSEEQSWGKIVTWGAIVLVVVGAIGIGVWKWLSNRRKPKISEGTELGIS